jgi:altronate hydrolase
MPDDMDIDAGRILSGAASVEQVGEEIFQAWLRIASGEHSFSEAQGLGDYEFVPWQIGATM